MDEKVDIRRLEEECFNYLKVQLGQLDGAKAKLTKHWTGWMSQTDITIASIRTCRIVLIHFMIGSSRCQEAGR